MRPPDFLAAILSRKSERVEAAKQERSIEDVAAQAARVRAVSSPHALRRALSREGEINVIAEFKRASPSKGLISDRASPGEAARSYYEGGAAAVSVLTEEDSFLGSLDDLRAIRAAVSLPVLRKDFIFDEYQLYESALAGADALLLIVAALDDDRLHRLRAVTEEELGMDALVEVHTEEELQRAHQSGATLVGVNNRNLHTFEVSLEVSVSVAAKAPPGLLLVSESGLRSADDIERLRALGYCGFLIGEQLMRANEPAEELRMLVRSGKG
ncbi:MAG TPA: indole-3-glycerol phosphate synthase TrpC [Pyrinomonadaceae bacterium]|nr:indole-3-glycerol phosphate synthase TrpC [Pyrinomonadaceae bacterium]